MRVALAVTYDGARQRFETCREATSRRCSRASAAADLVVGFNVRRFDYHVLRGYTDRDLARLPPSTCSTRSTTGSASGSPLGHLGEETLGVAKSADGLQSLRWWQEGRVDEIETYCRADVALLRDLFEHAARARAPALPHQGRRAGAAPAARSTPRS